MLRMMQQILGEGGFQRGMRVRMTTLRGTSLMYMY